MAILHETAQESIARIRAYREQLPTMFPALFEGQTDYWLICSDNHGDENSHKFTLTGGRREYDEPSFQYKINLEKNHYELVYNCNCHVVAKDYSDLVEKRNAVIDGKVRFIRVPEFQAKVWIGKYGVDFWANGAGVFCPGAHDRDNTIESCVTFSTRYLFDSYSDYTRPRGYEFGKIERENRVEEEQLTKEIAKVKRRKKERAKRERDESPEFEIFIEETLDYDFSFKYSLIGVAGEKRLPTPASKEEIAAVFEEIFRKYLE